MNGLHLKMKSKIYLAKSNKANPDQLMAVRAMLSRFDVDVVEYNGGTYSHKPMLECDKLFILPDLSNYDEDEDCVGIGKGLHQQIETWHNQNNQKDDEVYMIVNPGDDYYLRKVDDLDMVDGDNYVDYSIAVLDYNYNTTMLTQLISFFGNPNLGESKVNKNISNKYKYLLCGK
jgi:hypothetical protein